MQEPHQTGRQARCALRDWVQRYGYRGGTILGTDDVVAGLQGWGLLEVGFGGGDWGVVDVFEDGAGHGQQSLY